MNHLSTIFLPSSHLHLHTCFASFASFASISALGTHLQNEEKHPCHTVDIPEESEAPVDIT